MLWPDILIGAILLIGALKGYKRGFIMELAGAIALVLAFITPWFYGGALDGVIISVTHVGPGAAHVIGFFAVGVLTYLAVLLAARALNTVMKLPVIGLGNALAGAGIGLLKAYALVWVVLYIALFFPLSRDIRGDLHRSKLVAFETLPNRAVDGALISAVPPFLRPLVQPVFARHHA